MLLFARISLAYLACCSAPSYHNVWPALCASDFAIWSSQSASTYPASSRYIHAKQFKRANRELKFLRTRLGRLMRDIRRKIADWGWSSPSRSARRCASGGRTSISAVPSSIHGMRRRSSASARASLTNPMSSASRSQSRRPTGASQGRPVHPSRQGAARQSL